MSFTTQKLSCSDNRITTSLEWWLSVYRNSLSMKSADNEDLSVKIGKPLMHCTVQVVLVDKHFHMGHDFQDLLQESGFVLVEDKVTMPSAPCESSSTDEDEKQVQNVIISLSSADSLILKPLSVFPEDSTLLPRSLVTVYH